MAEGVDYSWARPGGAALAAAGKTFAVRYLWAGGGKGITSAELADLRAHGLAVAFVFESSAARALAGRAAGRADAATAHAQLVAIGAPGTLPIYFGVDFDANAGQQPAIDEYLRGAGEVLGANRVGVYGSFGVVARARANGSAAWYWQTYAWSGGKVVDGIHLYQYRNGQNLNGSVDFVRSYAADFGQLGDGAGVSISPASVSPGGSGNPFFPSRAAFAAVQGGYRAIGYTIDTDGVDGPATRAVVSNFQSKHGLTVDGVHGPATEAALVAAQPSAAPAPAPSGTKTADFGRVDVVQRALKAKFPAYAGSLRVDNADGPATRAAVSEFQRRSGLTVDGVAGPKTRHALGV